MAGTLITDRRSATATYKTIRRLGKGGMAEVFLSQQVGMAGFRRLAVVKRILPQFSEVSSVAEMLLDEARIAAQLNHPNIVQIYELGHDEGYFIAMEYVDGCDLATLARIERHRQSRIPIRLTLRVISEAAMGIDYAHRQVGLDGRPLNVVHRDVSPHNIMCSREGAVKVTDFGIAKAVGKVQVTEVGVVKGKVQYMAPEQYTGAEVDHRADIFSLGVVLYQLTTGKLPRSSKDGNLAMRRVIEGKIPRPSEIRSDYPDELEAIVMRALAHEPADRYADAASFRDELLDFARQHDMLAFPKELGDYVNELVPSEDHSGMLPSDQPRAAAGADPVAQAPTTAAKRLARDKEKQKSEPRAPHNTERLEGQQRIITGDVVSDPFGETETEIPIDVSAQGPLEPAVGERSAAEVGSARGRRVSAVTGPRQPVERSARTSAGRVATPRAAEPAAAEPAAAEPAPRGRKARPKAAGAAEREPQDSGDHPRGERRPAPTGETRRLERQPSNAALWVVAAVALVGLGVAIALLVDSRHQQAPPPPTVKPTAGTIVIAAAPANATIAVDGAARCHRTPCRIKGLPVGRELRVTAKAKGHYVWMQTVVIPGDGQLDLTATLTPMAGKGSAARPAAVDSGAAKAPPSKKPKVAKPRKPRKPRGQRPHRPRKPQPAGGAGGRPRKGKGHVARTKADPRRALLVVDVRPSWAEVWVDGVKRGVTPIQLDIKPGRRKIELKNPKLGFHVFYRVRAKKGIKIKIADTIRPR